MPSYASLQNRQLPVLFKSNLTNVVCLENFLMFVTVWWWIPCFECHIKIVNATSVKEELPQCTFDKKNNRQPWVSAICIVLFVTSLIEVCACNFTRLGGHRDVSKLQHRTATKLESQHLKNRSPESNMEQGKLNFQSFEALHWLTVIQFSNFAFCNRHCLLGSPSIIQTASTMLTCAQRWRRQWTRTTRNFLITFSWEN